MKASQHDQLELLRLQELDSRIAQATRAIAHPPQEAALAELAPVAAEVRGRRRTAQGELDDARTELSRVESDVKVVEARIARDSERVQGTASVKDIAALESELEALRKRRSDLEDIELAIMERIEGLEIAATAADDEDAAAQVRLAELEAQRSDAVAGQERARAEALADRKTVGGSLPEDLLALYDRQFQRYGVGAARLVAGVSLGSNMKLSPSDLATARAAAPDEVVLCPDSGAILIRDENS